jgi:hypothetical protein
MNDAGNGWLCRIFRISAVVLHAKSTDEENMNIIRGSLRRHCELSINFAKFQFSSPIGKSFLGILAHGGVERMYKFAEEKSRNVFGRSGELQSLESWAYKGKRSS